MTQGLGITILHSLPGRLRVQLSWPPKNVDNMKKMILGHAGINSIQYTPVTRSLLIYFEPCAVTLQEIILRTALALSQEHGLIPVRISAKREVREMSDMVYYSGILLAVAAAGRFIQWPQNMLNALNVAAYTGTVGAVLEHAWTELKRYGVYDPEVLSVVYLVNSMLKGEALSAAVLTWVTTFGRHLLRMPAESVIIQAFQVKGKDSRNSYYDVVVSPDRNMAKGVDFIRFFLSSLTKAAGGAGAFTPSSLTRQIRDLPQRHGGILEGMGGIGKGIIVRLE